LFTLGIVLTIGLAAYGQRRGMRGPGSFGEQQTPPSPKTESEKRILATIDEAFRLGELYSNVPAADGRMLRILAESMAAKNAVEIGTSTGISGMWLCLALEKTGGRLTTFELDPGRAAMAASHFKKAGVDRLVTIVQGDAHANIKRLKDPIDLVFIDAEKEGYESYLQALLPLVRPGGLVLAHNSGMIPEYLSAVSRNPDLETIVFSQGGGMAITMKKR
jgi:predicted O-methyltransferase YrrM